MQPFVSTIENKLDAKRRVSVPASFRQILLQEDLRGIYCLRSFVGSALDAYGANELTQIQTRIDSIDPFFSSDYDALTQILAESRFLEFDDEGRVRLPDDFIAHAGIAERVTFVGMNKKFQIWDPERYAVERLERLARARTLRTGKDNA